MGALHMHVQNWPMEQKGSSWVAFQTVEVLPRSGWGGAGPWGRMAEWVEAASNPSPSCPSWHWSPSPSPPWSCPAEEWLQHSLENLKLQPRSLEPKSRAQQCNASPQKEEKLRKQVWFEVDEELSEELDLPSDLILFLAEGTAPKQRNTPSLPAWPPPPPQKVPSTAMPWQEDPGLKFQQHHSLVNPTHDPGQGRKREAGPCEVSMLVDHRRDVSAQQPSSPLVVGD